MNVCLLHQTQSIHNQRKQLDQIYTYMIDVYKSEKSEQNRKAEDDEPDNMDQEEGLAGKRSGAAATHLAKS